MLVIAVVVIASLCVAVKPVATVTSDDAHFYAHRGLSAEAPEDTLAAFNLAAEAGYYGIDCDLWPTAKDKNGAFDLAVSHDNNLRRIAGINRNIRDMTAKKVRGTRIIYGNHIDEYPDEFIPMASDFFAVASRGGLHAIVEMKGKGWSKAECRKLLDSMEGSGMLDKTIVNSMYIGNLKTLRECAKKYSVQPRTMYTIFDYGQMDKKLRNCVKAGIPIASMRSKHIIGHREKVFRAYRKYGIEMLSWTADEKNEKASAKKLIRYGVKSIVTDAKVFR